VASGNSEPFDHPCLSLTSNGTKSVAKIAPPCASSVKRVTTILVAHKVFRLAVL